MDKTTIRTLEILEEKLEVPIEHLWEVMVHQAKIETIFYSVSSGVVVIITMVWLIFLRKKVTPPKPTDDNPNPVADWQMGWDDMIIPYIITTILLSWSLIQVIQTCIIAKTAFLNPEYWALKELMNL